MRIYKFLLLCSIVISTSAFNQFAGKYEISLKGHSHFDQLKFTITNSGILELEKDDDFYHLEAEERVKFEKISNELDLGSKMEFSVTWLNDGSPEMVNIQFYLGTSPNAIPYLIGTLYVYNDGDTSIQTDVLTKLIFSK